MNEAKALCHDVAILWGFARLRHALMAYGAAIVCLVAISLVLFPLWRLGLFLLIGFALFLPVEYILHRYVLHPLIYLDFRWLARIWIRIHYAHHRVPDREEVILASPLSGPLIFAFTNPPFLFVFEPMALIPGAAIVLILFGLAYEPVHYAAHKPADFKSRYLRERRRIHLLHHYHNEQRNFGICGSLVDRLVGTHADRPADAQRSLCALTLGYGDELASAKPLVRTEYERSLQEG